MKYDSTLEADLFTQALNSVPEEWENRDREIGDPILFVFDGAKWRSIGFMIAGADSEWQRKDGIAMAAREAIAQMKPFASLLLCESSGTGAPEMLVASLETSTSSCVASWDIIRSGLSATLGPVEIEHNSRGCGRFQNLFQRPDKVQLDA